MGLYWSAGSIDGFGAGGGVGRGVRRLVRHSVSMVEWWSGGVVEWWSGVFNQYFMQKVAEKREKLRVGQPPHSGQN